MDDLLLRSLPENALFFWMDPAGEEQKQCEIQAMTKRDLIETRRQMFRRVRGQNFPMPTDLDLLWDAIAVGWMTLTPAFQIVTHQVNRPAPSEGGEASVQTLQIYTLSTCSQSTPSEPSAAG